MNCPQGPQVSWSLPGTYSTSHCPADPLSSHLAVVIFLWCCSLFHPRPSKYILGKTRDIFNLGHSPSKGDGCGTWGHCVVLVAICATKCASCSPVDPTRGFGSGEGAGARSSNVSIGGSSSIGDTSRCVCDLSSIGSMSVVLLCMLK